MDKTNYEDKKYKVRNYAYILLANDLQYYARKMPLLTAKNKKMTRLLKQLFAFSMRMNF